MFSETFNVKKKDLEKYGAFDISLIADTPMFIDPILIFNSKNPDYQKLHHQIIKYMYFLLDISKNNLDDKEIKTWFVFNEVCNNWFGFSMKGNKGQALDIEFGKKLYKNISFVTSNSNISEGIHSEKIMLIYPGSGKDKISDMTVNLIKGYLCSYTEKFALKYMNKDIKKFYVEKSEFNYKTNTFCSNEYTLPYIINEKGKEEYILLTPKDILRFDEPSINRTDMLNNIDNIRNSIDNDSLRIQLNQHLQNSIIEYQNKCKSLNVKPKEKVENKIKKESFESFSNQHKELYDYYIKLKESASSEIINQTRNEVDIQITKFNRNVEHLIELINNNDFPVCNNSYEEAKQRVLFFKNKIECNDCNKLFYSDGNQKIITTENDLQRMFKFAWYDSKFKNDAETNNGRGPADFVVSFGNNDVTVIEFKLAKNKNLNHVFEQTKIYDKANSTKNDIIVIFYFDDKEYTKTYKILKDHEKVDCIDDSVFLIDCRPKESASKPNSKP